MKSTLIDATSPKTWALIFDKGDEPVAGRTAFAKSQNVGAAEPRVHAHVVVGRADGEAGGGHLLEAHVWPTFEVVLVESPRRYDPETGLALIDPTA